MKKAMKKMIMAGALCVAGAALIAGCGDSGSSAGGGKQFLNIATGGTAGTYYPLGGALAELLNQNIKGMNASAQSTGAPPARFEAGTQPVAQVVAAGVAAEWLMNIGMENLEAHERVIAGELLKMGQIDGVRILGPQTNEQRIGTVAFEIDGVHPHDVGQFIDAQGIAIRVGHHCAQPVHRHFGVYASNRASSGIYNSVEDAQALVEALKKVRPFFGVE